MTEVERLQQRIHLLESELAHAKGKIEGMTEGADMLRTAYEEEVKMNVMANAALEVANSTNLSVMAENQRLKALADDLTGTLRTREAELGSLHHRFEEIDRARVAGVTMLQGQDQILADLRAELDLMRTKQHDIHTEKK